MVRSYRGELQASEELREAAETLSKSPALLQRVVDNLNHRG